MSTFMGFAIGILIGSFLGAMGMYLLVKETHLDSVIEREAEEAVKVTVSVGGEKKDEFSYGIQHCATAPAPEIDGEELEMPQEVKYGDF